MTEESPPGKVPDEDLIGRSISGDNQAYQLLIERYQEMVNALVWRLVPDQADREEVCQDVFTRVYFKLNTFRFDSKFSTWLYTIAYRTAISSLRRKKLDTVSEDIGEEDERSSLFDSIQANSHGEHDEVEYRGISWEDVQQEISKLDIDERTAIVLFYINGCSIEEIAKITERPDGTVKNQLFRVRRKLKQRLARLLRTNNSSGHIG